METKPSSAKESKSGDASRDPAGKPGMTKCVADRNESERGITPESEKLCESRTNSQPLREKMKRAVPCEQDDKTGGARDPRLNLPAEFSGERGHHRDTGK